MVSVVTAEAGAYLLVKFLGLWFGGARQHATCTYHVANDMCAESQGARSYRSVCSSQMSRNKQCI